MYILFKVTHAVLSKNDHGNYLWMVGPVSMTSISEINHNNQSHLNQYWSASKAKIVLSDTRQAGKTKYQPELELVMQSCSRFHVKRPLPPCLQCAHAAVSITAQPQTQKCIDSRTCLWVLRPLASPTKTFRILGKKKRNPDEKDFEMGFTVCVW